MAKKYKIGQPSDWTLREVMIYQKKQDFVFFFSFSLQALPAMPYILNILVYFKNKFGVAELQC